jgi:hypothetical protein
MTGNFGFFIIIGILIVYNAWREYQFNKNMQRLQDRLSKMLDDLFNRKNAGVFGDYVYARKILKDHQTKIDFAPSDEASAESNEQPPFPKFMHNENQRPR